MVQRRIFIAFGLFVLLLAAGTGVACAQADEGNNLASQPAWGPAGYPRADHYYLPDVECYYSVAAHQFISLSNGRWIFTATLPPRYASYNLFTGYKVVINEPRPYLNFADDQVKYAKYKGLNNKQPCVRKFHSVLPGPAMQQKP